MQIRKATMNDLPDILAIYAYARKYMKEHGNPDQWRDSYPPVSLTTQDIQSDCLYVCIIQIEEDEQIGGVFYFHREEEFPNIKIDTHDDNIPMQHLLVKLGFTCCGHTTLQNGDIRLIYQKAD